MLNMFNLCKKKYMALVLQYSGRNIIGVPKKQNNFWDTVNLYILTFLFGSLFRYRSSNFAIAKVVDLNLFA